MPMEPKDWIDVTTEKNHYSLDHFVIPKHYEQDVSSILIPHGVIMVLGASCLVCRVTQLVHFRIVSKNSHAWLLMMPLVHLVMKQDDGKWHWILICFLLVVCCILKGGHQYFADLVNYIKALTKSNGMSVPLSLEFIRVKSYKNDQSEGVTISLSESECKDFAGKVINILQNNTHLSYSFPMDRTFLLLKTLSILAIPWSSCLSDLSNITQSQSRWLPCWSRRLRVAMDMSLIMLVLPSLMLSLLVMLWTTMSTSVISITFVSLA